MQCDTCERSEEEIVLIKFPFVSIFKGTATENEHSQEAYICPDCIKKEH